MWLKGESFAIAAPRASSAPRTTPSERDLALLSELTVLLQAEDRSDAELLDDAVSLLAEAAGATYVFDLVAPVRCRHREGGRSARHEAAIDLQTLRAMTLRRAVFSRREEADALGLDWMLSVPIDGDDGPIGAITTYAQVDDGTFPSMPLVMGVAQLVGSSLTSRNKRAAMRAAIDRRDAAMTTLAHDLKSPLAVILAAARLLRSGRATIDDPTVGAEAIERQATYMLLLVNDILELGVMSAPGFVLNQTECVPARLIHDALGAVQPLAAPKDITLSSDVARALPTACADARRITQVLVNLLGNAIKFTPRGGSIVAGCRRRDRLLSFYVSDTGPGIAPEDRERVFDRFWRADQGAPGSGLGLAIAREIVEAHGGTISIDGVRGRGTTVSFTLPTCALS
jgi:signal transduction histidine kinase